MNAKIEQKFAAERLCIRLRWLLFLAATLVAFDNLNPVLAAIFGLFALSNAYALTVTSKLGRYKSNGKFYSQVVRFVDAVGLAGLAFATNAPAGQLIAIGLPIVLCEAFVFRSIGRVGLLSGLLWLSQSGILLLGGSGLQPILLSLAFYSLGATAAVVLAAYQSKEEILASRDRRLASVLECGTALAANKDLRETLLHTLKAAVRETGATGGYVMLLDEESGTQLVAEAAYCGEGSFDIPQRIDVGFGMSGFVAKMGQPMTVSGHAQEHRDFDGMGEEILSACAVPLQLRGYSGALSNSEVGLGVFTLFNTSTAEGFTPNDVELLRSLASIQAVAVSNARMESRRRTTFLHTMESLATALEARDEYTRGHSQRVCELSLLIGERLGFSSEALEELRIGTVLHDIGKIGVPDAILNKKGRLTNEEFAIMKQHPVIGYEICKPLVLSEGVLLIIRNHHEKLDGSGYPDGLKGGELPLSLRVVCVADAFDAMSSKRPYRGIMDTGAVVAELSRCAGSQFDPVIVETLKGLLAEGRIEALYRPYWETDQKAA